MLGYVHPVGTPWYVHPVGTPWYTLSSRVHPVHTVHPAHARRYTLAGMMRVEDALGSKLRLIRENEAQRGLSGLEVSLLLVNSAQSYSVSPGVKCAKIG